MRITEVFGPGESVGTVLVIDYSSSARDVPSSTPTPPSLCQTKRTSSPFFSTAPSNPPTRCLLPLPFHFPVPLPPPPPIRSRSSLSPPRCIHTRLHTRNEERTPFLFLFSSFVGGRGCWRRGCSRRRGDRRRKKSWKREGREDGGEESISAKSNLSLPYLPIFRSMPDIRNMGSPSVFEEYRS